MTGGDLVQRLLFNTALFVGGCSLFMSALVTNCCVSTPVLLALPLVGAVCVIGVSARLLLGGQLASAPELRRRLVRIIVGVSMGATALGALPVYAGILPWWLVMGAGFLACAGATLWRMQLDREEAAALRAARAAQARAQAEQEQSDREARGSQAGGDASDGERPAYGRPEFGPERDWGNVGDALNWDGPGAGSSQEQGPSDDNRGDGAPEELR